MPKKIIIAIDGFSSCGKSTLAKAMAKELSYVFIDTGAMYRAIALYFLRHGVNMDDPSAIDKALQFIQLHFVFNPSTNKSDIYLNGENVEKSIREMTISQKVSEVAALPAVRDFAVAQQQVMGVQKGIVMDGRDIGTVVFPDAALKIFVTADKDVRVERRYLEMSLTDPNISKELVAENLAHRDFIDSTREHSPLRQAADAIVLDNTYLNQAEQLALALSWVKKLLQ